MALMPGAALHGCQRPELETRPEWHLCAVPSSFRRRFEVVAKLVPHNSHASKLRLVWEVLCEKAAQACNAVEQSPSVERVQDFFTCFSGLSVFSGTMPACLQVHAKVFPDTTENEL